MTTIQTLKNEERAFLSCRFIGQGVNDFRAASAVQITGMVVDILKLPADDIGAVEFIIGGVH